MESKWEVKEWDEESYAITDGKITIVTSDAENGMLLSVIAEMLNESEYRFHSENKLELDQHLEIEMLRFENQALKEKTDKTEQSNRQLELHLINGIASKNWLIVESAMVAWTKALSRKEGEKEVDLPIVRTNTGMKKEAVHQFLKYVKVGFEYLRKLKSGKIEAISKEKENDIMIGSLSSLEILLQEFE